MLTGLQHYHRPKNIEEALKLLTSETEKNVILGGGSLLALFNSPGIEGLIDISNLNLDYIRDMPECLEIGASTTIRKIQRAKECQNYFSGVLSKTALSYLTALLRNQAQLGGILAGAFNTADIVGALMALDAIFHFATLEGEKKIPAKAVYENPYDCFSQSILTKVSIPKQDQKVSYHRIANVETDTTTLSVFVCQFQSQHRIVVNSCGNVPVRLYQTEQLLDDCQEKSKRDFASIYGRIEKEFKPISDIRASAEYRMEMVKVFVKRGILALA